MMFSPVKRGNRSTGFSLVEMLVVISLITLLISLLMPNLGRSKEVARRVKCMGQQRSMQQMCDAFSVDNAEKLPDLHDFNNEYGDNNSSSPYWFSVKARDKFIESYGLLRETCYCPSNQEGWNRDDFWNWPGGNSSVWGYLYFGQTNKVYSSSGWAFTEPVGGTIFANNISSQPKYSILFADLNRQYADVGWYGEARLGMNHVGDNDPAGTNITYLDGHGEWVPWPNMALRMFTGNLQIYW